MDFLEAIAAASQHTSDINDTFDLIRNASQILRALSTWLRMRHGARSQVLVLRRATLDAIQSDADFYASAEARLRASLVFSLSSLSGATGSPARAAEASQIEAEIRASVSRDHQRQAGLDQSRRILT